jgi:hypothetical protein
MNEQSGEGQGGAGSLCDGLLAHLLHEGDAAAAQRMADHVRTCPQCQERIAMWQEAMGAGQVACDAGETDLDLAPDDLLRLPVLAQDVELAQSLREKVLAAAPRGAEASLPSASGPSPTSGSSLPTSGMRATLSMQRRRWRSVHFALPVATLLIGLAAGLLMQRPAANVEGDALPAVTRVLASTALVPTAAAKAAWGTADLVAVGSRQQVVVSVHDLPPLVAGQCYNLWLVQPGGKRMLGGMLVVNSAGSGALTAYVPSGMRFVAIGITREPTVMDKHPTGAKVIGAALGNLTLT